MYEYRAKCLGVIDGDTADFDCDLGFLSHTHQRLRLAGINCPEKNTKAGMDAKAFAVAWLAARPSVMIRTVKDKQEKFGRFLAYVWDVDGAECLNAVLVLAGHAVEYDGGKR